MNLQLVILRTLKLVHPRLMTTGTLWSEVLMEAPGTTYSAYREALIALEEKSQVVCVTGEDRDRVKLTDAGVARLRENAS